MDYLVKVKPAARRQLDRFNIREIEILDEAITSLGKNPYPPGVIKLKNTDYRRIRVRDLRVIYFVDEKEKVIYVERIARRNESTYKGL